MVLQVRDQRLCVLLWRRALEPEAGRWALPGGRLGRDETLDASIARHLAAKVDLGEVGHLEQLATRSEPDRFPGERLVATAYLGVVASDVQPDLGPDTAWHPVDRLPRLAFDHGALVRDGRNRLRAKLSYTNLAFALTPRAFTISELRQHYEAALGHDVDPTNLQRVLVRRDVIEPTKELASPGRSGGRPATRFRFRTRSLVVTDPGAVLRPPSV